MSAFERRKHPRVTASIAIEVRDERGFSLLSTRDLSGGGAYFDRSIPKAMGQRVEVRFTLPGEMRSIRCEAQIANVPDRHAYGMGVRFMNLSVGDEQRISDFTTAFAHRAA